LGSDIHGFWEFKAPHGDWIAFELINDSRSYTWFRLIADVRGLPLSRSPTAHRGIPEDSSQVWRQMVDAWARGLHSHTWLTSDEVRQANRDIYVSYVVDDGDPVPEDLSLADHYHETIPSPVMEIERIYLPGPEGRYKVMPWTGTLCENVGSEDLSGRLRMVIAFDN
jgi:hypothetical protein